VAGYPDDGPATSPNSDGGFLCDFSGALWAPCTALYNV